MQDSLMHLTKYIYTLSRYTQSYFTRQMKKLDLSMGQFGFLLAISRYDGISQEELSDQLRIDKSTTAKVIQQLIAGEFIARNVSPSDRRSYQLHITSKGLALIPGIEEEMAHCHELMCENLTEIERMVLLDLLQKAESNAIKNLK